MHMPIIRIITAVVIPPGPARGEGWVWKLGLRSGCLAQPTNLHHMNPRPLRSGLEMLVRHGSPRATSHSRAGTRKDAGTGAPISQVRAGGRPAGDLRPGWRSPTVPNAASLPSVGGLCRVSWEPGLG